MDGPQFARLFDLRGPHIGWFLGAGASAASNIPTGYDMIVDFKAGLFCKAVRLSRREIDPGDPLWAERIDTYFDGQHGFPPSGSPDEYASAFEAVYPEPADRRAYIERAVQRGVPAFAHRVLASLISSGRVPCLFTTNFDDLVERSATIADDLLPVEHQHRLTIAALDSADRAERSLRDSSWPLLVQLHGDYRSEQLKNTREELREQDERLRRVLVECCQRFGLAVVGYSGRDASVMDALRAAVRPLRHSPLGCSGWSALERRFFQPSSTFWSSLPKLASTCILSSHRTSMNSPATSIARSSYRRCYLTTSGPPVPLQS